MTPKFLFLIGCAVVVGLFVLDWLDSKDAWRRFVARFFGPEPPSIYECCVTAHAARSEAGYNLHRVRDHGIGSL